MPAVRTVEWLSKALNRATKAAKFCEIGVLPSVDPGLVVDGLGRVNLPLKPKSAKALIESCQVAPFGKGEKTLYDQKVRKTFELDPAKFQLSDEWNAAVAALLPRVAEGLGLPADRLESHLYKLLVYERGGFFQPHRDSEKLDRMVASLIVVLPNFFGGGALLVRHGSATKKVAFEEAAAARSPCFAAFYADCEHEAQRVDSGVRICLTYNLVLKPQGDEPSAAADSFSPADELARSIDAHFVRRSKKPLVFALDHHYTERGLAMDLLKGEDRRVAALVVAAADKADCVVHLAQVSRHTQQEAFDGGYDYVDRRRNAARRPSELGDIYEDDLSAADWTDVDGGKQPWGEIPFDSTDVVASTPIDDWKPTSEEYEGYTGNAGNTLDRWYHRSALVVWRQADHFDILAAPGVSNSIPLFCSMAANLAKTPNNRLEEARSECLRFARAIIDRWPNNSAHRWRRETAEHSPADDFSKHLLMLHDRDVAAALLTAVADRDESVRLGAFVTAACREFGWRSLAGELKRLITTATRANDPDNLRLRDVEWLEAFCCDESADPEKTGLAAELCRLIVKRFCKPSPWEPVYYGAGPSVVAEALPMLLKALVAVGDSDDLSRVILFVQEKPDEFRLDDCQVPCLQSLIPWAKQRLGTVHPELIFWLDSVRRRLQSATAVKPTPPTDSARPAVAACTCDLCRRLDAFLADPVQETIRIPASEDLRQHLIETINRSHANVTHELQRTGRPYSLVLTKTTASFKRALARYEADCKLLSSLPVVDR